MSKVHTLVYKDADKKLSRETWEEIKKDYADQDVASDKTVDERFSRSETVRSKEPKEREYRVTRGDYATMENDASREELFADEASAYYTEAILGGKVTVDMLLGKNGSSKAPTPTAKKILDFFSDAARAYSKDAKLSREARRHYKRFKAMFDAFAEWNKGRNAETAVENAEDSKATRRTTSGAGEMASPKSIAWKNVAYDDSGTKAKITADLHKKMVEEGSIVKIPDETTSKVSESYPDLQGMKKKERLPILKDSIKQLKNNLRMFLTQLKGKTFEFEVEGDVLEAKLYNVGIDEVLEKVTQDKAEMLYTTEEIFKNSRYLYSTPDYDGDTNIYRWNYFYTPVQIGENVVGVRIAIRDMVKQGESQIYNWGIKKDTSLGGVRDDYINRKSNDASSDVSSNPSISQNGEKSTDSAKKVAENSAEGGKSIRKSKDITPKVAEESGTQKPLLGVFDKHGRNIEAVRGMSETRFRAEILKRFKYSNADNVRTRDLIDYHLGKGAIAMLDADPIEITAPEAVGDRTLKDAVGDLKIAGVYENADIGAVSIAPSRMKGYATAKLSKGDAALLSSLGDILERGRVVAFSHPDGVLYEELQIVAPIKVGEKTVYAEATVRRNDAGGGAYVYSVSASADVKKSLYEIRKPAQSKRLADKLDGEEIEKTARLKRRLKSIKLKLLLRYNLDKPRKIC